MNTLSEAPVVKGWCPGLYAPMQAADGWLVRVRPEFGRLTAAQALCLAQEAEQHGKGHITLTNRANLQLRGFSHEQALAFPARMQAAGLGLPDPAQEKRLALQITPLAGLDPICADDTLLCARLLKAGLLERDSLSGLPDKFGFAVEGGGICPVGALKADILLQTDRGAWRVACGAARSLPLTGPQAVQLALQLAEAFVMQNEAQRPMRNPHCGARLFAACGQGFAESADHPSAVTPPVLVGQILPTLYGMGVPLGSLTVAMLRACAHSAASGDGWLYLTPWHSIVLAGQKTQPLLHRFVTDLADPRLRVFACEGVKGCAQASVDVPALALQLAADIPVTTAVHVAGCSKGCAHPAAADVSIVAGLQSYALVRNGTAGDEPTCHESSFDAVRARVRAWAAEKTPKEG
ncbi:precorrin-3B synthase [Acetobacter cibinongensis]|uniref:Cobalamin (Vitamin B12) biosynthesis protein precorrin-3B biosynthesis protein CobG n=1 Tax=Acetobacter cibinongensis TaxID=146475 RepID=A0A0D6N2S4_9PROT|nr:precorrin-3B synthase [Acetobacter cibinongensis]GAN59873.1 cobalamin (vitamin B12) biosynthesis protein precorrin-3B biosynthesis protein CobG [Acetobacter cibinongensis]GBQ16220.1 cobalamin biosynthesis protein precorrin-3B biosynthesis protein CobG [Acetobacter cibinongensis NRIC 0482]GEL57493.1 precorrin-3B synthase [Acetobacter cibinongensis]